MNKDLTLFSLFIIFILSGCDGCKKKANHGIDAALKSNFNYQQGTYWIYKDSIGGSIDSFVVISNKVTPSASVPYQSFTEDVIDITIADYKLGPIFGDDSTSWLMHLSANTIDFSLNCFIGTSSGNVYFSPYVTYPFAVGSISSISDVHASDTGSITQILPTYTLDGQSYNNVAEIFHKNNFAASKYAKNWFYMNTDVGIIKMRVNYQVDTLYRVWELQRCNIVK